MFIWDTPVRKKKIGCLERGATDLYETNVIYDNYNYYTVEVLNCFRKKGSATFGRPFQKNKKIKTRMTNANL